MSENKTVMSALLVVMAFVSWFVSPFDAYAVPAAPLIHTLSQPDGSTFKARQWGDEFLNGWETEDGYTILFDKERKGWTYAVKEETGRLVSSSKLVKIDTLPLDTPKRIRPSRDTGEQVSLMTAEEDDYQPFASPASPTGTANIPVLTVNFPDTTTTYTTPQFNTLLFGTGNYSMKDYYQEVSYGLFNISAGPGGIAGWYPAKYGHDYYGYNQGQGWVRAAELAKDTMIKADQAGFNFAPYDRDGDCYVDVVAIIHQGDGTEASGDQTDIWSHSWSLIYGGVGEYTTNDDCLATPSLKVKVDKYVMQPETLSGGMPTIGVFAHEYGHALGLPDLYDVDYTSQGIGNWSLMAGGTWNYHDGNIGNRPAHLDAWSKYFLGWITPTEVSGTLVNEPITQASTAADVYKLLSGTPSSGEYFLVENRQQTGFDEGLPGAGLLIWHIDAAQAGNTNECYPGGPSCASQRYKVALVQADNRWDMEKNFNRGDAGDPYPGSTGKTSFNAASSPDSAFYNGLPSWVSIRGISASGSTMSCTLSLSGQYTLSVTKAGTGSGTVTSTPAGIDCGPDCSEPYNPGTPVTLTAAPVAGSVFTGWSGAGCSGTGQCAVTMNDDTAVTATFAVHMPDLTEAALTISKSGTSLRIDDRVANQGTEPAGAFDISYYLSLDNSYSAGTDTYLCKRSVTGLAAGASNPASGTTRTTCPIPSVPAGNYYVVAVADSGNTVAESNETNNTRSASVSISGIDLLPTAITATKSGANAVSVSDTVKNQGSSSAGSFTIRYYLSTDTTYQSGTDIALATSSSGTGTCSRTVSSLRAGSTSRVNNKTCYKPSGAVNGVNYYIIVVDDTGSTVSEYVETNNSKPTSGTISW